MSRKTVTEQLLGGTLPKKEKPEEPKNESSGVPKSRSAMAYLEQLKRSDHV